MTFMVGQNKDALLNSKNYYMQIKYREGIRELCDALSSTQIIDGALCVSKYHEEKIKSNPWLYHLYQTCTQGLYYNLTNKVSDSLDSWEVNSND